ncbi:MAG: anaerobic ribonucleoside-triphosphate reductase [Candidatus Jordarchaeum sp.]|uniref:anaerobic ribonucleoside-triphosphate reductase n=1 Tax=Candidatus Jordarchaeum sp. TaxID=2823881 RepID=UPI004049585E
MTSAVLSALSSETRIQILKILSVRSPLSFTKIMQLLEMDTKKEAGKFAYHLGELAKKARLVNVDEDNNYTLTGLGEKAVEFIRMLEEFSRQEKGELYVRTSRLAIERFDRKKIANSLVREARVPKQLAENIATEAEERLLKSRIGYLTAPLIREFVNAILLEKRLEEYRHALTRLGLPVYDVTTIIKSPENEFSNSEKIHKLAGDAVLEQYLLLKILPREIADAHLSGVIHIPDASYWILRPNNIQHDIYSLLSLELRPKGGVFTPLNRIINAETIISQLSKFIEFFQTDLSGEQSIDNFNIFLAPFLKGMSYNEIKSVAHYFVSELCCNMNHSISVNLELITPKHLKSKPAIGPKGKTIGKYEDFEEEAQIFINALIDIVMEEENLTGKPFLTCNMVFKLRPNVWENASVLPIIDKIFELSASWGNPFFINSSPKWQNDNINYTGALERLGTDWSKDWELDTQRTGNLGTVIVNLPRIAYESNNDDELFFELLRERLDMASTILEIKSQAIRERMFNDKTLPALTSNLDGEVYYRVDNSTLSLSFVGLDEAVKKHIGTPIDNTEASLKFPLRILKYFNEYASELKTNTGLRWVVVQPKSGSYVNRLAKLDVEKFGKKNVSVSGIGNNVYYSTSNIRVSAPLILDERIKIESMFHPLLLGGHLMNISLEEKISYDNLIEISEKICKDTQVGNFTFTRDITYCFHCAKSFNGIQNKCTKCGSSMNNIARYSRNIGHYFNLPFKYNWEVQEISDKHHYF